MKVKQSIPLPPTLTHGVMGMRLTNSYEIEKISTSRLAKYTPCVKAKSPLRQRLAA